jgi:multimeric flavodoxin WrbA
MRGHQGGRCRIGISTTGARRVLVLAGPIRLGDNGSVLKRVVERLYACSGLLNDAGQYAYYGRVRATTSPTATRRS